MDSKKICKKIIKIGGELVRTRGSHRQYRLPNGNLVTVPYPKKIFQWEHWEVSKDKQGLYSNPLLIFLSFKIIEVSDS